MREIAQLKQTDDECDVANAAGTHTITPHTNGFGDRRYQRISLFEFEPQRNHCVDNKRMKTKERHCFFVNETGDAP